MNRVVNIDVDIVESDGNSTNTCGCLMFDKMVTVYIKRPPN